MLVEPQEFIDYCRTLGCTDNEFLTCANNLTSNLSIVDAFYKLGQQVYYRYEPHHHHLQIVTIGTRQAIESKTLYAEAFGIIRHLSH